MAIFMQTNTMKKKNHKRLSKKAGLPPGTPVHIGKARNSDITIELVIFSEKKAELIKPDSITACKSFLSDDKICWFHIDGVHDTKMLEEAGEIFGISSLIIEDIANTQQRPKYEEIKDQLFFTLKHFEYEQNDTVLDIEQLSIIVGSNYVLSFREKPDDLFDNIRDRLLEGVTKARSRKTDYLFYLLVDAIVDSYYEVIEKLEDKIEEMEDYVISDKKGFELQNLQSARRELILLLKAVFPLRESIGKIIRRESKLIEDSTIVFFADVYDHTVHIIEAIETQRDLLSGLLDIFLSANSNRMNSVMKVLTIIATIFIPITFLAGVYGMNFKYFPELRWEYGYAIFWLISLGSAGSMIYYFKKQKWF